MRSVSQRLLIGLTLLLLLFFGAMIGVLEASFRDTAQRAQRELLKAQMLALIASTELDDDGHLLPRLPDYRMTQARVERHCSGPIRGALRLPVAAS